MSKAMTMTMTMTTGKKYIEARGARKTAVARVRLIEGGRSEIFVNEKDFRKYFKTPIQVAAVEAPLNLIGGLKMLGKRKISAQVRGGGLTAQSEAVRHGLAQALSKLEAAWRPVLKQAGYLTRDARVVERKKYGLKKARRAPQWSKR